jgi:hypothetical protein
VIVQMFTVPQIESNVIRLVKTLAGFNKVFVELGKKARFTL